MANPDALQRLTARVAANLGPVISDLERVLPRQRDIRSAIYVLKNLKRSLEDAALTDSGAARVAASRASSALPLTRCGSIATYKRTGERLRCTKNRPHDGDHMWGDFRWRDGDLFFGTPVETDEP